MTKHVHCEVIKAWADGAEVEFLNTKGVWTKLENPTFLEKYRYRVVDEYRELREAQDSGKVLEILVNNVWCNDNPEIPFQFFLPAHLYRIKPDQEPEVADPYKELRAAQAAGKIIQYGNEKAGWVDGGIGHGNGPWHFDGDLTGLGYRVKPEADDPYKELREAQAAGKKLQYKWRGMWLDNTSDYPFDFSYPVTQYRIKPDEVEAEIKPEPKTGDTKGDPKKEPKPDRVKLGLSFDDEGITLVKGTFDGETGELKKLEVL